MMTFYNKITQMIQDKYLNTESYGSFNIKYLNNTEAYNPMNIANEEECRGVTRLVSTNVNSLSDTGSENRVDVLMLECLIPLGDTKTTFYQNKLNETLNKLNGKFIELEDDTNVLISNCQLVQDLKLDGHINGIEYEQVAIQIQLNVSVDFLYSNEGILTIDGIPVDCKASVVLNANKIAEGNIYQASYNNGIQQPRFNGLQYSFDCTLIYNKNNTIHKALLRNWMCGSAFDVCYTLDELTFERRCQITQYTLNAITADTVKLRVVFTEAGADFSGK